MLFLPSGWRWSTYDLNIKRAANRSWQLHIQRLHSAAVLSAKIEKIKTVADPMKHSYTLLGLPDNLNSPFEN